MSAAALPLLAGSVVLPFQLKEAPSADDCRVVLPRHHPKAPYLNMSGTGRQLWLMKESTVVDEWDGEGPGPLGYTEARLQALWPQVPGQAGPLAQPDGRCRLLRALVAACNQGCITMQASLLHPIDTSVPPGGPANGAACQLHAVRVSITLLPSFWDQDLQLQQQPGGRDPLDAAAGFLRVDLLQLLAASAATAGPSSSGAEGPSSPAAGAGATANRAVEGVDDVRDDVFQMLNCGWAAEVADPPGLRCSLYRYQRRALAWMCWRELEGSCPGGSSSSSSESAAVAQGAALHPPAADPAWTAVTLPAGGSAAVCYCNALEGRVSRAPPAAMRRPPGGILADEMGLGKTVEVIALMLKRPAPASQPAAAAAGPSRDVAMADAAAAGAGGARVAPPPSRPRGTNLIVTPPAILRQWEQELARHSGLSVTVYEGLKWHRQQREAEEKREKTREKRARKLGQGADAAAAGGSSEGAAAAAGTAALPAGMGPDAAVVAAAIASGMPAFDADKEAGEAVGQLLKAQVILTTYDVLQREVHYSPAFGLSLSLRHAKRYVVPESPLLQLQWWRVVFDEAQMVGVGLGAVATMATRISSTHRWCVTGTPMGVNGLDDIQGQLRVLQYAPLSDPRVFRLLKQPYLEGGSGGRAALAAALSAIMWRSSKAVAAEEHPLPARKLTVARLRFSGPERSFYDQVLDKLRGGWAEAQQREAAAAAAAAAAAEGAGGSSSAGGAAASPSRQAARAARLREATSLGDLKQQRQALLQLRLACIHPQMTAYWRELSSELQLDQGGALSMSEILGRMRDQAQLHLQAKERDLCMALNALAVKLLAAADQAEEHQQAPPQGDAGAGPGPASQAAAAAGGSKKRPAAQTEAEASSGSGKRAKVSGGPSGSGSGSGAEAAAASTDADAPKTPAARLKIKTGGKASGESPASPKAAAAGPDAKALRQEALAALESSHRVGEKGIEAVDSGEKEALDDITAAAASIRAWRYVQVHTLRLLERLHAAAGGSADQGRRMCEEAGKKAADVSDSADVALAKARSKASQLAAQVEAKRAGVLAAVARAEELGFPAAPALGDVSAWLAALGPRLEAAKAREKQEREAEVAAAAAAKLEKGEDAGVVVERLMGTAVRQLLEVEERGLKEKQVGVEAAAGSLLVRAAVERIKRAQQAVTAIPAPGAAASSCWAMQRCVDKAVLWQAVMGSATPARAAWAASVAAPLCGDGASSELRQARNRLERRLKAFAASAAHWWSALEGATGLGEGDLPLPALLSGLEVARGQVDLVRLLREQHVAGLQVELATSNRDAILEAVGQAGDGEVAGMAPLLSKSLGELRRLAVKLQKECEALQGRKRFFKHQVDSLEGIGGHAAGHTAPPRRQPGPADSSAAGEEASGASTSAGAAPAVQQPSDARLVAAAAGPAGQLSGRHHAGAATSSSGAAGSGCCSAACLCAGLLRPTGISAAAASRCCCPAWPACCNSRLPGAARNAVAATPVAAAPASWNHAAHDAQQQQQRAGAALQHPAAEQACAEDTAAAAAATVPNGMQGGAASAAAMGSTAAPAAAVASPWLVDESEEEGGGMECVICREIVVGTAQIYPCGHYYCESCSQQVFSAPQPSCPTCRARVSQAQVFRVAVTAAAQSAGAHAGEGGAAAAGGEVDASDSDLLRTKVSGQFGTKIEGLVRRLLLLKARQPQDKSLVFSQWPDALKLVGKALTVNGLGHVSLLGKGEDRKSKRSAVPDFNDREDVRVFLLSLGAGAAGLTLTKANHVFLLEPSTDPAVEQQAVARVHRIGQEKPVSVTRLINVDSVETKVLEMLTRKQALFVSQHHGHGGGGAAVGHDGTSTSAAAGTPGSPHAAKRRRLEGSSRQHESGDVQDDDPGAVGEEDEEQGDGGDGEDVGGDEQVEALATAAPKEETVDRGEMRSLLDDLLRLP